MTSNAPRISVSPARRYSVAAGRRWPVDVRPALGELLSSWLLRLAHANGVPPRYFGAVLEPLARHGRHNLTGICRRPFAACCSTIRRSAPKNLTASVLAPASSQSCACVCGPGRTMQRHRRRSPPGFNAVLSACGMMRCPASVVAGRSQPACHVSTTVADCATVALPVDRALRRSNGIASCHSNTATFAILISRNRRTPRARGPGASSG